MSSPKAAPPPVAWADMKKRAVLGSGISVGAKLVEQVIRFGSNYILAKLLFPGAFGVMGLIMTLQIGLEMLSDLGVRVSVVTHKRTDETFLNTAWTISVLRGVALFLIGSLVAVPFARFYDDSSLALMVPVACIGAIFTGATSTKQLTMNRELLVGRIMALQLFSQVIGLVVLVGMALWLRSTWALVLGTLFGGGLNCVLSHVALPGPNNRFCWDKAAAHDILRLGGWIFISTLLAFFAQRLDILLLGKLVPKEQLGVYNISTNLSGLPGMVGGQIIGFVLLPALAGAFRENPATFGRTLERVRRTMLPAGAFLCMGVALGSPALFYYLFDTRYHDAVWMTPLLVLSSWFVYLQDISGRSLTAIGIVRPLAMANAGKLFMTFVGCIVGHDLMGVPGFILGAAAGSMMGHVITVILMVRAGLPAGRSDLLYTLGGTVLAVLGVGGPIWLERWLGWPRMPTSIAVALLVLIPLGLGTAKRVLAQVRPVMKKSEPVTPAPETLPPASV
jgi:O-antigen/teichoic acid export membrane protein